MPCTGLPTVWLMKIHGLSRVVHAMFKKARQEPRVPRPPLSRAWSPGFSGAVWERKCARSTSTNSCLCLFSFQVSF